MTPARKNSRRTSIRYRLAQTLIPDYANKSIDEQIALFSELILDNPQMLIHRVWSELGQADHRVILSELGFFEGKVRAQQYEWAREDVAELKRHTRMLKTFLEKQVRHESVAARRPHFYGPRRYSSEPVVNATLMKVLELELTHLKWNVTQINRMLKKLGKWDPRGMIRAQEYIERRADFLGLPKYVRLSPNAIADLYELAWRTNDGNDNLCAEENIRKAIANYRKNPENAYFIHNIEFYLADWKKSAPKSIYPENRG